MFVIKVQGGFGNQLFQYALYRNFELNGTEVYLDVSEYNENSYRKLYLKNFRPCDFDTSNFISVIDTFSFIHFLDDGNNYYLDGYWQNENYFSKHKYQIKNDLRCSFEIETKIKQKYPDVSKAVSIHVRRGDYVNLQHAHPLQPISYYENALNILQNDFEKIFVFSDDLNWCRENLKFEKLIFVELENDIHEFYCMSMCKHNIISNSTFSWWAAYLNKNENKKIIAPKNWLGEYYNHYKHNNFYPENFVVM